MALNIENNVEFKFWAWLTSWTLLLNVKSWKETLLPVVPFKLTLIKFDSGWAVTQREIVTVTNKASNILTITRASEACPKDDSATTKVATPYDFDENDSAFLTLTAQMTKDLETNIESRVLQSEYDAEKNVYGASSEWTDAYKITDASILAYSETRTYKVKADVANTGACTFEINSLWAKAVKKQQWTVDLETNDWKVGWIATLVYNLTLDVFQYSSQNAEIVVPQVWTTVKTVVAWEDLEEWDALYIKSDWKAYKTNSTDISKISFIWFALTTVSLWDNITINTTWTDWTHTWLTFPETYFLWGGGNITWASYDSKNFAFAEDANTWWISFKPDWLKMYMVGYWWDKVYQYTLSTAWDVSTASYDTVSFSVLWEDATMIRIHFKLDGTKFYWVWQGWLKVYQYSLGTAWDLSTASYDSKSFSLWATASTPSWIFLKPDGLKMYVSWFWNDRVYQYTLSTAWDVSTATYDTVSFYVGGQDLNFYSLFFNDDWTKMIMFWFTEIVYEYDLSTWRDLSTAVYNWNNYNATTEITVWWWLFISPDGVKMYLWSSTDNKVFQYTIWTPNWSIQQIADASWFIVPVWTSISATEINILNNPHINTKYLNGASSNSATAWWIVPPNITEFITIKANWVDRKVWVYAV